MISVAHELKTLVWRMIELVHLLEQEPMRTSQGYHHPCTLLLDSDVGLEHPQTSLPGRERKLLHHFFQGFLALSSHFPVVHHLLQT